MWLSCAIARVAVAAIAATATAIDQVVSCVPILPGLFIALSFSSREPLATVGARGSIHFSARTPTRASPRAPTTDPRKSKRQRVGDRGETKPGRTTPPRWVVQEGWSDDVRT